MTSRPSAHFQHGMQRESLGDLDRADRPLSRSRLRYSAGLRPGPTQRRALASRSGEIGARGASALRQLCRKLGRKIQPVITPWDWPINIWGIWRRPEDQFEATVAPTGQGHVPALEALGANCNCSPARPPRRSHSFRSVLELAPDYSSALNNLAWILATHPDDQLRDAAESLRLATKLVDLDGGKKAEYLDTLAVAQAASGQFEEAAATARRGVSLAQTEGQNELASQIQNKIALYARGEAFRDRK